MALAGAGFINRDSSHLRPETFGVGCFDVISRHAPGCQAPRNVHSFVNCALCARLANRCDALPVYKSEEPKK